MPWAQGPAHPTDDEYDLETVILHELGHWAGNLRHTPVGCHDTPMVKGLGPGEWWRSPSDWHYDACGARPRPRGERARRPVAHRAAAAAHRAGRRADRRGPLGAPGTGYGRCMDDEKQGMRELEENPPKDLEDWPDDERKYETFGGREGDPIPGGPTDPDAGRPDAERNSD